MSHVMQTEEVVLLLDFDERRRMYMYLTDKAQKYIPLLQLRLYDCSVSSTDKVCCWRMSAIQCKRNGLL
jgi:hypothetical protein